MKKTKLKPTTFLIGLATILIIGFISLGINNKPNNSIQNNLPSGYEGVSFNLLSNKGKISATDFKGKHILLYVGYTFCPDVCPTNLGSLSQAYQKLTTEEKDKLQIIFVSVDPDRDTPERMAEYSHYFEMNMLGLTGDKKELDKLVKSLGAAYKINKDEGKHYSVDHSAYTYVISPETKLVEQIPHGTNGQQFLTKIQQIIKTGNLQ
jgi:protein SCO1/2